MSRSRWLPSLYVVVVGAVAVGGLFTIVEWAVRGDELAGGGVAVTGRVIEEQPGFAGAKAIVEVAYEAGGKERRARLPVAGSDEHPQERTYNPGDPIALLVARDDPERVQPVGWGTDTPSPDIPGWVLLVVAAGIVTPLLLPGPRRRLQAALPGPLRIGGGRGI